MMKKRIVEMGKLCLTLRGIKHWLKERSIKSLFLICSALLKLGINSTISRKGFIEPS